MGLWGWWCLSKKHVIQVGDAPEGFQEVDSDLHCLGKIIWFFCFFFCEYFWFQRTRPLLVSGPEAVTTLFLIYNQIRNFGDRRDKAEFLLAARWSDLKRKTQKKTEMKERKGEVADKLR